MLLPNVPVVSDPLICVSLDGWGGGGGGSDPACYCSSLILQADYDCIDENVTGLTNVMLSMVTSRSPLTCGSGTRS